MKLLQCFVCCTGGGYKVFLDREEEMIKASSEDHRGWSEDTSQRTAFVWDLADKENLSRNEQIHAKNQLLGSFSAVGKRFLA